MAKAKLNREQQTYVVQSLACFDSPSVVAAALRKEFSVTLTPQSIEAYDPTKKAGKNLAERWKAIFEETRKAFLEDTSSIAISHRAVRLRALQRMADKAETAGRGPELPCKPHGLADGRAGTPPRRQLEDKTGRGALFPACLVSGRRRGSA